jgi:hypothetical protein
MNLLLTDQERERFAAWLEHEAATENTLVAQMEKLGPSFALVIEQKKLEANASLVIARKLRSTQSMSIG